MKNTALKNTVLTNTALTNLTAPKHASLTIQAPAKLNLFLHVTGRREDGYHELETLFQFLSVHDVLHIEPTHDGHIHLLTEVAGLAAEDNLVFRAAQLLLAKRKNPNDGARIMLQKHLPMGGGLGGGSSDAASTLIALNHLWGLGIARHELAELGLQLGADVPVFVHGQAALARGVGEQFSPAEPPEAWYLIIDPHVHVSTADIFAHPDLPRATSKINNPNTSHCFNWKKYRNDCEELVRRLYPQVAKASDWLVEYAPTRMTGTGACVFGCFASQAEAQAALTELPAEFSGFVAQGLNTSPAWQGL